MPDLFVTDHAVQRYRERVRDLPDVEIRCALSTRAFVKAADLGRCAVILPTGHRAVMRNGSVITVLPLGAHALFASRFRSGGKVEL